MGGSDSLEVCGDVADDVEPCDIHRPERGALGAAERRASDGVNFLDGVLARFERLQHVHDGEEPDVIGDEIRPVLCDHDPFAETDIREAGHALDDRRIRLRRRNDLDEMQIPRRVEEVRAEPVAAEALAPAFGERSNGNA